MSACQLCGEECHDVWWLETEPCPEAAEITLGVKEGPKPPGSEIDEALAEIYGAFGERMAGASPWFKHTMVCERHYHLHAHPECITKLKAEGHYPTAAECWHDHPEPEGWGDEEDT